VPLQSNVVTTAPNRLLIAVSSTPILSASTVWTLFQFQHDLVGTTPNSDTGGFVDFPQIGIDSNAIYIGVNVFSAAGAYVGTTGFVVRKSSVLGAGPIVITPFRGLAAAGAGPESPVGVDNLDASATALHGLGVRL